MSDNIFELKLQIQQLQDKVAYLAGGTNGEQLVNCIQERDEAIRRKDRQIKEQESQLVNLACVLSTLDAKRKNSQTKCTSQVARIEDLERELAAAGTQCAVLAEDIAAERDIVGQRDGHIASLEEEATRNQRERSELQQTVEAKHAKIEALQQQALDLRRQLTARCDELAALEERRRDTASRARAIKQEFHTALRAEQEKLAATTGRLGAAEAEVASLRERCRQEVAAGAEASGRAAAAEQEGDALRRRLAAAAAEKKELAKAVAAGEAASAAASAREAALAEEGARLLARAERLDEERKTVRSAAVAETARLEKKLVEERARHEDQLREVAGQIKSHEQTSEAIVAVLEGEVATLVEKLEAASVEAAGLDRACTDAAKRVAERDRRIEVLHKTEQRWGARMEAELSDLRQELHRCRGQSASVAVLAQENAELRARIERQEAFVKRRFEQEKWRPGLGGGAIAVAGSRSVGGGGAAGAGGRRASVAAFGTAAGMYEEVRPAWAGEAGAAAAAAGTPRPDAPQGNDKENEHAGIAAASARNHGPAKSVKGKLISHRPKVVALRPQAAASGGQFK